MATKDHLPFEATHPGTLIKDELEVRDDLNQKELAKEMGVKPSFLNEIIKGKRPITADFAILLEAILGISADYWMRFQSQYEIDKARIKEKSLKRIESIEHWKIIKESVPVNYLKKKKCLSDSIDEDIRFIFKIYGVSNLKELTKLINDKGFLSDKKLNEAYIDNKLLALKEK